MPQVSPVLSQDGGQEDGLMVVIAVSGLHGSGKSTYAREIARQFGLRYVSAGMAFRKVAEERGMTLEELTKLAGRDPEVDKAIDEMVKREAERGDVVLDGLLVAWMAGDRADIKIFLTAPFEERVRRIAVRDGKGLEDALEETKFREEAEADRFRRYYGIDIHDLSIYDVVLNTALMPLESNVKILKEIIREYIASRGE